MILFDMILSDMIPSVPVPQKSGRIPKRPAGKTPALQAAPQYILSHQKIDPVAVQAADYLHCHLYRSLHIPCCAEIVMAVYISAGDSQHQ